MKNTKTKTWGLKIDLNKLPLTERKDSLILLYFLNEHKEQIRAFKELKNHWVDNLFKLPKTSDKRYNSIKNGRYKTLQRMRRIFEKYVVKIS